MFELDDIVEWEGQLTKRNEKRLFKTTKNYFCPRIKKMNDYSHHRLTKHWYKHEAKIMRKMKQRKFRRNFKNNINQEEYFKVVPHDYRTYGWETW